MNWVFPFARKARAIEFYKEYGFVGIFPILEPADILALRGAFDEAVSNGSVVPSEEDVFGCDDAIFKHSLFEKYAKDPRLLALVEELFGADFELQHAKLNCKPMGNKEKGVIKWHQDFPFFPHTNYDLVALTIHLDDEDEASGSIQVIPRSHEWGVLSHCRDGEFLYVTCFYGNETELR